MPLPDYDGNTFVAYVDISGFKQLMRKPETAVRAMDRFYQAGYDVLKRQVSNAHRVHGLFVSDCSVLFVDGPGPASWPRLSVLLQSIQEINRTVLQFDVMTTASVAFGQFRYHRRLEFPGIEKNPVYGNAYVAACLDNEHGSPKMQPGQCRILGKTLPPDIPPNGSIDALADCLVSRPDGNLYFYWMVGSSKDIVSFDEEYANADVTRYALVCAALKGAVRRSMIPPTVADL